MQLNKREDFVNLMFQILNPLKPYYSKDCGLLKLGETSAHYADETAWMEGFARPLWALAPYFAGGGVDEEWEERYRRGLVAGTDPKSAEYWGTCHDYDQKLVEMAAIAFTILLAKDKVIDPMTKEQKDNLYEWLMEINRHPCYNCNWRFFHVLVNIALKKSGISHDAEGLEDSLEFLESAYIGDGWYADGPDGYVDYYVPFAMHFYGIVYAMFMKEEDPERCERFLERALLFGKEFVYWFAEDGSAVPHGRSQTYRFAQVAFYSACVMAHIEPLPLGVMKGLIVRHLRYWMEQPIFDHAGILTIGYCYPNLQMSESYNAPGSPYWAMKTFACLALPEEDIFWHTEALPLPKLEGHKFLKSANMIVQRMPDGQVVLLPAGGTLAHVHTHTEEKYSKFAYSSKYGFSVMRSAINFSEAAPDSVLSFEVDGHLFVRRQVEQCQILENKIISDWSPFQGIQVHTEIVPTQWGHQRIHTIESIYDCVAFDAGFALPVAEENGQRAVCIQGDGEEFVMGADPNTNLMCSKTKIPVVRYQIHKGNNKIKTEIRY